MVMILPEGGQGDVLFYGQCMLILLEGGRISQPIGASAEVQARISAEEVVHARKMLDFR
jgi:hypothetical protein